jgi:predicted nucleic acid-binding Zn finger protein
MKKQKEITIFVDGVPNGEFCNVCAFLKGITEKNGWGNCRKTGSNVEKIKGKYIKCVLCPVTDKEIVS